MHLWSFLAATAGLNAEQKMSQIIVPMEATALWTADFTLF